MKFKFEDLPIEFQRQNTTRAAFFNFNLSSDQKINLLSAIDSNFSDSQREKRVNGYIVSRQLALFALKYESNNEPNKFIKTLDLVDLFSVHGTKIAKGSLNAALQSLVKLGLLSAPEVDHGSDTKREWRVYQFSSAEKLSDSITNANLKNYAPVKARKSRTSDQQEQNTFLTNSDILRDDAVLSRSHLPKGIAFLETVVPKPIWDLAYNKDGPHNTDYRKEELDGYVIEIKGHKKINTKPALMTGLILVQIAIAYNAKMLSQGKFKKPFEKREIPIFTNDLMSFKGSDGGSARERAANEIELLRNTVYDIHNIMGKYCDFEHRQKYVKTDYRFLDSVRTSSDSKFSSSDPGAHVRNASLYIIRFSEEVETILGTEELMFSLPLPLLSANNLLVTFYLHLRRQKIINKTITFEDLILTLPFTGSALTLSDRLKKILDTPAKTENGTKENYSTNDNYFEYNLFGYYIKFTSFNDELALEIKCDTREMIEAAGLKYNDEPGSLNAPTMANPLFWLSQSTDEIQHSKELRSVIDVLKKDFIDTKSLRNSRYRHFIIDNRFAMLTHYSSAEYMSNLATIIAEITALRPELVEESIQSIQAELNPIKTRNVIISAEDITALIEHIQPLCKTHLNSDTIVSLTTSFRLKKLAEWKERDFSDIAKQIVHKLNTNNLT